MSRSKNRQPPSHHLTFDCFVGFNAAMEIYVMEQQSVVVVVASYFCLSLLENLSLICSELRYRKICYPSMNKHHNLQLTYTKSSTSFRVFGRRPKHPIHQVVFTQSPSPPISYWILYIYIVVSCRFSNFSIFHMNIICIWIFVNYILFFSSYEPCCAERREVAWLSCVSFIIIIVYMYSLPLLQLVS